MSKKLLSLVLVLSMLFVTILPIGTVLASEVPVITLKCGSTVFSKNGTYTVNVGDVIQVSTSIDVQYIKYQIGTGEVKTVNASSFTYTVPDTYESFSFQVYAKSVDGVGSGSAYDYYTFNVPTEELELPTITVKSGSTTLVNSGTYTLNVGDKITISATPEIEYIKYKVGSADVVTVNSSSATITVTDTYESFSLQVLARNASGTTGWYLYNITVPTEELELPTITVKSGSTTLVNNGTYTLNAGDKITISATPEIEYIKYKIGTGDVVTVNSSSTSITVPDTYESFSLQVFAKNATGYTGWYLYNITVPTEELELPTITVKSGSTTFANNGTYTLNAGDKITISATPEIEYISYKVGTGDVVTVNSSSTTITVPDTYEKFSLQVLARNASGTTGWYLYNINVPEELALPTITVKSGSTTFANNGTYTLEAGDKITISATPEIEYISYKVGTGDVVTVNSSSTSITVPDTYEKFSLQVLARNASGTTGWYLYNINVPEELALPTITVKSGSTTFSPNGTYTLEAGDKITISATPEVEYIKYKIGTGSEVTITGGSTTITVPSTYEKFSLQVLARNASGTTGWYLYNINVQEEEQPDPQPTETPILELRDEEEVKLVLNSTNVINSNEKLEFKAAHSKGISKVTYKFDSESETTVNSATGTIKVPAELADGQVHTLTLNVTAKDGSKLENVKYKIKVLLDATDYGFILNYDEILNPNATGLQVSLRTVTDKDGNNNIYLVDETIKYYIDYANFGSNISGNVTLKFNVPENVSINFRDIKGGTKEDSRTISWTFNGLDRGEKGTIVLTLKYTSISGNSMIVKPVATIKSSSAQDSSAVENLICKSSSTKLNLQHEPYMVGDAGTNTFRPYEGLNRAEMAMILTRIFDIPLVTNYTVTYKDADVIAQNNFRWAEQAIMTVTKYGLMEGYDDGEFKPGEKVTKAQLITVIARRFEVENETNGTNPFEIKSNPIKLFKMTNTSHWSIKYITQLMRMNMLSEVMSVNGNPDVIISRAEVACLINTCLYRGPSQDGSNGRLINTFVDVNKNTPLYEHIIEASADKHNSQYTSEGIEIIVD